MANLSDLFPSSGALPAGLTKDPRFLPAIDGTLTTYINGTIAPSSASFWNASGLANVGSVSSTASDDTYSVICDVTGTGFLTHVFPQECAANTDTVTFRITVDGVETVIQQAGNMKTTHAGGRFFLGCADLRITGSTYTSASDYYKEYRSDVASPTGFCDTGYALAIAPVRVVTRGMPCVYFESSLKVEAKVSALGANTYSQYSGAAYRLIGVV